MMWRRSLRHNNTIHTCYVTIFRFLLCPFITSVSKLEAIIRIFLSDAFLIPHRIRLPTISTYTTILSPTLMCRTAVPTFTRGRCAQGARKVRADSETPKQAHPPHCKTEQIMEHSILQTMVIRVYKQKDTHRQHLLSRESCESNLDADCEW